MSTKANVHLGLQCPQLSGFEFKNISIYSEGYDHHAKLKEAADKSQLITDLNILKTIPQLDDSGRQTLNPLKQGVTLQSKNIFVDILDFVFEQNKELLYTLVCLISDFNVKFYN